MHLPRTGGFAALTTLALLAASPLARADDCRTGGFHWSKTKPAIDVEYIFCGKIARNVSGFHSIQLQGSSAVTSVGAKVNERRGVYDATVKFGNGKFKMSTFFPDHCSYDQIVVSVVHAANNREGSAYPWGEWGWSGTDGDAGQCMNSEGKRFKIRMKVQNGSVAAAFPMD